MPTVRCSTVGISDEASEEVVGGCRSAACALGFLALKSLRLALHQSEATVCQRRLKLSLVPEVVTRSSALRAPVAHTA
jgi:hypothetical protein